MIPLEGVFFIIILCLIGVTAHTINYTKLSVEDCLREIKKLKNVEYDAEMDFTWDIAIRSLKNDIQDN